MSTNYKTPGVYLVEKNAFANSVVEVATAIPMFIGYTEKAEYKGESVLNKPFRISSFADYRAVFGENAQMKFKVSDDEKGTLKVELANSKRRFRLFDAIRLFYQNGGATCYIMSVGSYNDDIKEDSLKKAPTPFEKEPEPTLVVIPEAVSLETADVCANVQNEMLAHCAKMKNRFAILDVFNGFKEPSEEPEKCIKTFRDAITNNLEYGAVYYPWLNTSVVQSNEVTFLNIDPPTDLVTILKKDVPETATDITEQIDKITTTTDDVEVQSVHQTLMMNCPKYPVIMNMIREQWNLMPPAGAIAGIYTMVDNSVGVWKAPANVGINGVITPAVNLSNEEQEDLNVPVNGKAVNAIRTFVGDGNKVWGARTLDGNSQDWRYVNVRRTLIMLEESIKLASKAFVFEPNTANTWVTMKGMISNFLTSIWKRGGLAGSTPEDAFEVYVGLGETMTSEDILDGFLRITVKVALIRPAEFIEITFQQQQQKS